MPSVLLVRLLLILGGMIGESLVRASSPLPDTHSITVGGIYKITDDLVVDSRDQSAGLSVTSAHGVVIDLRGHEIKMSDTFYSQSTGTSSSSSYANIMVTNSENVTIQNGVLGLSSGNGVFATNTKNMRLENVIIKNFDNCGLEMSSFTHFDMINFSFPLRTPSNSSSSSKTDQKCMFSLMNGINAQIQNVWTDGSAEQFVCKLNNVSHVDYLSEAGDSSIDLRCVEETVGEKSANNHEMLAGNVGNVVNKHLAVLAEFSDDSKAVHSIVLPVFITAGFVFVFVCFLVLVRVVKRCCVTSNDKLLIDKLAGYGTYDTYGKKVLIPHNETNLNKADLLREDKAHFLQSALSSYNQILGFGFGDKNAYFAHVKGLTARAGTTEFKESPIDILKQNVSDKSDFMARKRRIGIVDVLVPKQPLLREVESSSGCSDSSDPSDSSYSYASCESYDTSHTESG